MQQPENNRHLGDEAALHLQDGEFYYYLVNFSSSLYTE
jgi:hypothetical protein